MDTPVSNISAHDLIRGSDKMHEMEEVIKRTFSIIFGFVGRSRLKSKEIRSSTYREVYFTIKETKWLLSGEIYHPMCTIEFPHEEQTFPSSNEVTFSPKPEGSGLFISFRYIIPVYESLPEFIERMTEKFPHLQEHLDLLLTASKYQMPA